MLSNQICKMFAWVIQSVFTRNNFRSFYESKTSFISRRNNDRRQDVLMNFRSFTFVCFLMKFQLSKVKARINSTDCAKLGFLARFELFVSLKSKQSINNNVCTYVAIISRANKFSRELSENVCYRVDTNTLSTASYEWNVFSRSFFLCVRRGWDVFIEKS